MSLEDYESLWLPGTLVSSSDEEKARVELNESADVRQKCLRELKQMIKEQSTTDVGQTVLKELQNNTDDAYLLCFLRARKFSVIRAYDLLKGYVTFHQKYSELVQDLDIASVKNTLLNNFPGLSPHRDKEGRIVFMFAIGNWDQATVPFDEVLRGYVYLLKRLVANPSNQVHGFVLIENFHNYSLSQALSMRPNQLKKMVNMLQGAFPARFKGIHFINQPWYFTWVYQLVKPFLRAKLLKRVHVHGHNLNKFHKEFPPASLPEDFGGTAAPYNPANLVAALEKHDQRTV